MADSSRTNKETGDASRGPTEARDVADGAVISATGSSAFGAAAASSAAVTTTTVQPEGFPRCRFCFKFRRVCDNGRPCDSCSRNNRLCRDPTQEDLDQSPERALKMLRDHELQKPAASDGRKRPAAAPANDQHDVQKKKNKRKHASSSTTYRLDQQAFKKKQASEIKHCYRAINELLSDKYADCNAYFLDPVDHVALNLPHYRSIVEFPMDLGTIKENMEDGEYRIAREFKKDFMKVINAARLFNEEGSEVYEAANELQRVFDVVWKDTKEPGKNSDDAVDEKEGQPEKEEQSPCDI